MATLHTFRVVGYVFASETYCDGECITEALIARGRLSPAARDYRPEENLEAMSEAEALDAVERRDSDLFPAPVLGPSDELVGETCAGCGGDIDPLPEYLGRNRAGELVERCGCGSTEHDETAPDGWHLPC